MKQKTQLKLNQELTQLKLYTLLLEILVENGMPLSSPRINELKKEYDDNLLRIIELKEHLKNMDNDNNKDNKVFMLL